MIPYMPYPPPPNRAQMIAELQGIIHRYEQLADTVEALAHTMLMRLPGEQAIVISQVASVKHAWLNLMCTAYQERITQIENAPETPPGGFFNRPAPSVESLTKLVEQRDRIDSNLEKLNALEDKAEGEDINPGIAVAISAMMPFLEQQRDTLTSQIESMQAEMERDLPPTDDAPKLHGTDNAN